MSPHARINIRQVTETLKVQVAALRYFSFALSPSARLSASDLARRRGDCVTAFKLHEAVLHSMQLDAPSPEIMYELKCSCCQVLSAISSGSDGNVVERCERAAAAGAIRVLIEVINANPKPEQKSAVAKAGPGKGATLHLVDHAVAALRNITSSSEVLAKEARSAGARQEWISPTKRS